MTAQFTDTEKQFLQGKKAAIARKYGCSHTYINKIIEGKAPLRSKMSLKIYNGIKETVEFFKPIEK